MKLSFGQKNGEVHPKEKKHFVGIGFSGGGGAVVINEANQMSCTISRVIIIDPNLANTCQPNA